MSEPTPTLLAIHGDGHCHICKMPRAGEGKGFCSYPHARVPTGKVGGFDTWEAPPRPTETDHER